MYARIHTNSSTKPFSCRRGVDGESTQVEEKQEKKDEETDSKTTNEVENNEGQNEGDSDLEFSDKKEFEPVQAQAQQYTHKIVWSKDTGKSSDYGKFYDKDIDGDEIDAQVAFNLEGEDASGKKVRLYAGYGHVKLKVGTDQIIDYSKYQFYKLTDSGFEKVNKDDYRNIVVEGMDWAVSKPTGNTMWSTYSGNNTGYTALYQNMNSHIEYKKEPKSLILEEDKDNLDIKYNVKNKADGKLVENEKREVTVEEYDKFEENQQKWLSHNSDRFTKTFDERQASINLAIEQGYLEMYSPYTGKHNSYELLGSFKNEKHNKYYKLKIEGSDTKGWTVTLGSNLKEEKTEEKTRTKFSTKYIEDDTLDYGVEIVEKEGQDGIVRDKFNHIYLLDKNGDKETVKKTKIQSEKISELIDKIIRIGTKRPSPSLPEAKPEEDSPIIPLDPNSFRNKEDEEEYNRLVKELAEEIEKEMDKENPSQEKTDNKKEEIPSQEKTDDKKEEKPSVEKEKETDRKEENTDPKKVKKENKKSMSTPAKGKINPKTGVAGSGSIISILAGSIIASLGLRKKND